MKVSKCSEVAIAVPSPKTYSYEELQTSAPEGVYRSTSYSSNDPTRWIVITNSGTARALLVSYANVLLMASGGATGPFVRVENATVCFDIREPQA